MMLSGSCTLLCFVTARQGDGHKRTHHLWYAVKVDILSIADQGNVDMAFTLQEGHPKIAQVFQTSCACLYCRGRVRGSRMFRAALLLR